MDTTTQPTTTQPSAIEKVFAFVDERVGLKTLQAKMLNEPVPGGSRWAYVFGSILLFIFIMQAVTGILLMFYYVPTADHAYASTQYIIHYGGLRLVFVELPLLGFHGHGRLCVRPYVPSLSLGRLQEASRTDLAGRIGPLRHRHGIRLYRLSASVGSAGLLGHDGRRRDHGQDAASSAISWRASSRAARRQGR